MLGRWSRKCGLLLSILPDQRSWHVTSEFSVWAQTAACAPPGAAGLPRRLGALRMLKRYQQSLCKRNRRFPTNVPTKECKAGSAVSAGYCATAETQLATADRGLTSRRWLRISWKGMKCQACFHHSETVKTLPPAPPPPPPPPANWSPIKPSSRSPPAPGNLPRP